MDLSFLSLSSPPNQVQGFAKVSALPPFSSAEVPRSISEDKVIKKAAYARRNFLGNLAKSATFLVGLNEFAHNALCTCPTCNHKDGCTCKLCQIGSLEVLNPEPANAYDRGDIGGPDASPDTKAFNIQV